jgi:peroxiredoxin
MRDPNALPPDLPIPEDDGAAAHLVGLRLPHIALPSTSGGTVDLASLAGTVVVYAYPRNEQPGSAPLAANWDQIPGARGCTPHNRAFGKSYTEFAALGVAVYGLSTQDTEYQRELAERLALPFPILSDAKLQLATTLLLPTHAVAGLTLLKRLAWIARDGIIERVFYPVFPSDENAAVVLAALRERQPTPR